MLHLQGGKVLLLAESRAFFTVYRTITDTGMRIYQLGRDSQQDITNASDEVGYCHISGTGS